MITTIRHFLRRFKYRLIPQAFVVIVVAPVTWLLLDRTPPFVRLHGDLLPPVVVRGDSVRVRYVVTKRVPGRVCPGTVSQEIVDSAGTTFGKRERSVGPAAWEPHPTNPKLEIFTGWPVSIPAETAPGPAVFRTVTFRHCNFLQRWLRLSVVQIGPDIDFEIVCNRGYEQIVTAEGRLQCVPTFGNLGSAR